MSKNRQSVPLLLILGFIVLVMGALLLFPWYARNASRKHDAEGLQAARLEDYAGAAREFEVAARLDPDNVDALYNLGLAYVEMGRDREAVEAYSRAAELRPNEFVIHNNLGNAYNHLGDSTRAIQEWETALRLNPRAVPPRVNLALTLERMGQTDRALRYLREAAELDPMDPGIRYNLGAVYFRLGDMEKAEAELQRATRLKPRMQGVVGKLAMIHEQQGKVTQAVNEYRQAIREHPEDPILHYRLGLLLLRKGIDRKEAARELEQYLELAPDAAEAMKVRELLQPLQEEKKIGGLAKNER